MSTLLEDQRALPPVLDAPERGEARELLVGPAAEQVDPGQHLRDVRCHPLPRRSRSLPERRALLLLALAAGCGPASSGPPPVSGILLVTVDGLRGDEPAFAGGAATELPRLEALAAQGSVWLRAYTPAPLDLPSRATLLTGLEPAAHGLRDDGDFVLADGVPTLAQILAANGWSTASFTSSILTDRRWGLDRGFGTVVDRSTLESAFSDDEPSDQQVVDAAVALFGSTKGPLFAWVDLSGPHWPWTGTAAHVADAGATDARLGELTAADALLGDLVDAWGRRPGPPGLVVVTSPHGESLGEGGERTHGLLLQDATLRVPLVVSGPGFEPGARSSDPVGLVDVAPTLLVAAGLPHPAQMLGRDLRYGGSSVVLSESLAGQHVFGLAPLFALTDPMGRYVAGTWAAFYPVEADTVRTDPAVVLSPYGASGQRLARERAKVAPVEPAQAAVDPQTYARLATLGYVGGDPVAPPGNRDPRDAMDAIPLAMQARRFLDAGLTGKATVSLQAVDEQLPDAFGPELTEGRLLWQQGRLRDAEEHWRSLFERTPSGTVALQLASLLGAQDRWDEAGQWYEEAARLDPTSREALAGRLRSLARTGQPDLADDLALRYLATSDDHGELAPMRAELLLDQGEVEAALEEARRGVDAQPWSPWARSAMGRVEWESGQADRAIAELEEAVRLDPFTATFRTRLAGWLLDQQRSLEAVRVLAPAARLVPDDPEVSALYEQARAAVTPQDVHRIRVDRAHTVK